MRNLTDAELEEKWRKLNSSNYRVTSHATPRYNCLAFANGDERNWWESHPYGSKVYWPPSLRREDSLENWVRIFESEGYTECNNRDPEPGKHKVALYVDLDDMSPTHVAISTGHKWKSKLGKLQDIEHDSLDLLEGYSGYEYGIVELVLEKVVQ